jgi:hypothetical protein
MADGRKNEISDEVVQLAQTVERERTRRWTIGAICLTICFLAVAASVTAVCLKAMEDPPWLKLIELLVGPHAVIWGVYRFVIYRANKRLSGIVQSLRETPGEAPHNASREPGKS